MSLAETILSVIDHDVGKTPELSSQVNEKHSR